MTDARSWAYFGDATHGNLRALQNVMGGKLQEPFDDPQTHAIIGAGMAVHTELGCGFLERVYRMPFSIELTVRRVPHQPEVPFPIFYKGQRLPLHYRADYVCFDSVVVELKALPAIGSLEHAQMINYLKAAKKGRGLILNFGARSFQFKRVVSELLVDPLRRPRR